VRGSFKARGFLLGTSQVCRMQALPEFIICVKLCKIVLL
jgi:hypothetical protein